jgi:type I restriction enzyme R subunit
LHSDSYGNRDFLTYLRNQGKFFYADESRELDLKLIDYEVSDRASTERQNVYEVTEEFYWNNGHYGTSQQRRARGNHRLDDPEVS